MALCPNGKYQSIQTIATADAFNLGNTFHLAPSPREGMAVKHLVAKLVKSFGRLGDAAECLDDFRYTKG